jgi:hypothetical protein
MRRFVGTLMLLQLWLVTGLSGQGRVLAAETSVPVIPCRVFDNGQDTGLAKSDSPSPLVSESIAAALAYYVTRDKGVLGPRGWYCAEGYGSGGSLLLVSPDKDTGEHPPETRVDGPGIVVGKAYAETRRGEIAVAQISARLFPANMKFVEDVIAEGQLHASDFPRGPFPRDTVKHVSDGMVEYRTPAGETGLGTQRLLAKNRRDIKGVAILHPGTAGDLVTLSVRLESGQQALSKTILSEFERQFAAK